MNDKDNITRRTRTRTLTECAYCAKFTSGWLLIWHSGKLTVVRSLILSERNTRNTTDVTKDTESLRHARRTHTHTHTHTHRHTHRATTGWGGLRSRVERVAEAPGEAFIKVEGLIKCCLKAPLNSQPRAPPDPKCRLR